MNKNKTKLEWKIIFICNNKLFKKSIQSQLKIVNRLIKKGYNIKGINYSEMQDKIKIYLENPNNYEQSNRRNKIKI